MSLVNECDYFDIRGHAKFETNLKKWLFLVIINYLKCKIILNGKVF